jgi:hypothetical protein
MQDLFTTLHALTLCGPPKCLCSTAALTRQMDSLPEKEKVMKKYNLCGFIYTKAL